MSQEILWHLVPSASKGINVHGADLRLVARQAAKVVVARKSEWICWLWLAAVAGLVCPLTGCRPAEPPGNGNERAGDSPPPAPAQVSSQSPAPPSTSDGVEKMDPPASPVGAETSGLFRDISPGVGLDFHFSSGRSAGEFAIIESLGGGVAVSDFDRDGWQDVFLAGGGTLSDKQVGGVPSAIYRNGFGRHLTAVTRATRVDTSRFYSHGMYTADWNNDGFEDLAVTGYGGVQLFQNQGDGTFLSVGLLPFTGDLDWSTSISWADFDGDGVLDAYVTRYVDWSWENHPVCPGPRGVDREVCAPREFAGLDDSLLYGDGRGGFEVIDVGLQPGGKGLSSAALDANNDGRLDVYVANDTTDNYLYLNEGERRFAEQAILSGVSGDEVGVNTGSMGIAVADFDNNQLLDLWVTNFERELFALYRNEGAGLFSHVSRASGLVAIDGMFVGFGTVAPDVDLDGDADIVVANGHVSYRSQFAEFKQLPLLLINDGSQSFERSRNSAYFREQHSGRGLCQVDWDNDGVWDLIFTHLEEPAALLHGQALRAGEWCHVHLVGTTSNRNAIGAQLTATGDFGTRRFAIGGGGSYLSTSDSRLIVPVSKQGLTKIVVTWPSGATQRFEWADPGRSCVLVEPLANESE